MNSGTRRRKARQELAKRELNRRGIIEPLLTMGSAIIAEPVSGYAGLLTAPFVGADKAANVVRNVQDSMTIQPWTEEGQAGMEAVGNMMQKPVEWARFIESGLGGVSELLAGQGLDQAVNTIQGIQESGVTGDRAFEVTNSPVVGAMVSSAPTAALELLGLKGASKLSKGAKYEMGDIGRKPLQKQRGAVGGINKQQAAINELKSRGYQDKDLLFIHNTSAEKLQRAQDMGGMPMPSLAVTKKDIPFDSFGDISLIGRPESFDPKATKLNKVFSADAYTIRSPSPVRVARKGAGKRFQEKYSTPIKEKGGYTSEVESNIWDLEKKGDVSESRYNQVVNYFDRQSAIDELFLESKGLQMPSDTTEKFALLDSLKEERARFSKEIVDDIFEPEQYFIANPDRDYYTQKAKLKPYTADEVTKFMKKNKAGGEGGILSNSPGAVRASTVEQLKSLKAMRDMKGKLVTAEDMAEFKQTTQMMLDDLQEAAKPYYQYQADGFGYYDEFNGFLKESESMGLRAAGEKYGFDLPQEMADEISEFKDILRQGTTEYFEAKPERVVDLSEFGAAIVPKDTPPSTLKQLKDKGINVETYADEAEKLKLRGKYQEYLFQGLLGTTVGSKLLEEDEKK